MDRQPGFFDLDYRYEQLSKSGDPLERLSDVVNFEAFRYRLEKAVKRSDGCKGGRPPYDLVLMFKILVLQALYTLSDEQTEFMIRDRLSFMRFLGLGMKDPVPDATTIWLFREHLTRTETMDKLFARFDKVLTEKGYLAMSGQIMDATIVAAPRQRNTDGEKRAIKHGRIPEGWEDKPAKLRQKDLDARWTVKFSKAKPREDGQPQRDLAIPAFGYKNHISTDKRHGLIRKWTVTDAAAHDGARLPELLDKNNTASTVWADTAYRSNKNETHMAKNGFVSQVHRKKPKGRPMPERTSKANGRKSKVRAKVEHVFAVQKGPMALFIRTIGIARARTKIGMANLVYNMKRTVWLEARSVPG